MLAVALSTKCTTSADADLAELAKDRNLLGYFDIRLGNQPDDRLLQFIGTNLPRILPDARATFDARKELLRRYTVGDLSYEDFRVALGVQKRIKTRSALRGFAPVRPRNAVAGILGNGSRPRRWSRSERPNRSHVTISDRTR